MRKLIAWLLTRSLFTKIFGVVLVASLCSVTLGLNGLRSMDTMANDAQHIYDQTVVPSKDISALNESILMVRVSMLYQRLATTDADRAKWETSVHDYLNQTNATLVSLQANKNLQANQLAIVNRFADNWHAYASRTEDLMNAARRNDQAAWASTAAGMRDSYSRASDAAKELREESSTLANHLTAKQHKATESETTTTIWLIAASALLSLALGGLVAFSVSRVTRKISQKAKDLVKSSQRLQDVASVMTSNARETASASATTAASGQEVAHSIDGVATAIEELSASVQEIATSAGIANNSATSAVDKADHANETMTRLSTSSDEIGRVVEVIMSIAEQTNLLALNATIEAARAGEAGKGFAVVANEVKDLAQETARATDEIKSKVVTIQSDTQDAGTSLTDIFEVIRSMRENQQTIATAAEEQTYVANEISQNVHQAVAGTESIAISSQSVASTAEVTSENATSLEALSEQLAVIAHETGSAIGGK